jgi:hypothetical protein
VRLSRSLEGPANGYRAGRDTCLRKPWLAKGPIGSPQDAQDSVAAAQSYPLRWIV